MAGVLHTQKVWTDRALRRIFDAIGYPMPRMGVKFR